LITSSKVSTPVTTTDRPVTTTESKVVTDKYVIKSGDTISKIAKKNNVSVSDLRKANGLSEGSSLRAGRVLNIPRTVTTPVKTREQTISVSRQSYAIKGKDTFYSLANHYGISVKELQDANPGVDPAKLRQGTIIKIPVKSAPSQPVNTDRDDSRENIREVSNEPVTGPTARDLHTRGDAKKPSQNMSRDRFEPVTVEDDGNEVARNTIDPHMDYTVEPGDTWESIAAQFKTSRDEMKKINGIRGTDEPVTGTSILVPRSRVGHKPARSANRAA
jgi:LysM repeat protein